MIKCLLTEFGRAGRENIWLLVIAYGPSAATVKMKDKRLKKKTGRPYDKMLID